MSFRPGWAPSDVQNVNDHADKDNCVTIQKLLSGSAYDGYFKMDDRVVAINGCNVLGLAISDVLNVSKRCGDVLTLTIQRKPIVIVDDYETRRQQRRRSRQPTNPDSDNGQVQCGVGVGMDVANRDQTNIIVRSLSRSQSAHPESDRKVAASPAPSRYIASPDHSPVAMPNYGTIANANANANVSAKGYAPLHSSTVTVLPRYAAPQNMQKPASYTPDYGTLVRSRAPSEVENGNGLKYQPNAMTTVSATASAAPYQSAHVQHLSAVKNGDYVYVPNEPKAPSVLRNAALPNQNTVRPAPVQQRRVISQSVIDLSSQGRPEQKPAWLVQAQAQAQAQSNFDAYSQTPRTRAEPNATRLYQIVANERARPARPASGYPQSQQSAADRMTLASQF